MLRPPQTHASRPLASQRTQEYWRQGPRPGATLRPLPGHPPSKGWQSHSRGPQTLPNFSLGPGLTPGLLGPGEKPEVWVQEGGSAASWRG